MNPMFHKLSLALSVPLLEMMVACGVDPEAMKQKDLEDNPEDDKQATDTNLVPEHKLKAVLRAEEGLNGVTGTYSLINCTGHVDSTFENNRITVPDSIVGCRISIETLSMGNRVFALSDAEAEWKTGDVLHFKAMDGSLESLEVKVDHQLSSTPKLTEDVVFTVSRTDATVKAGGKTLLSAGVEGSTAPNFRIRKTEFVGINVDGAGQFVFHLDCLSAIKTVEAAGPTCNGMKLGDIRYQLVNDDFNSELTFAEADALFDSSEGLSVDSKLDFEPFKAERKQFGGFQTKTGDDVLQGPARISDHPHMILILQGPGPSYQYFNVDVVFTSN